MATRTLSSANIAAQGRTFDELVSALTRPASHWRRLAVALLMLGLGVAIGVSL